ncbi:MAG: hypothetical protein DMD96_24205 [Candidatus Rokuibacteriota bacterium]|nr:MAG: hypothetical protein DMD96_24205 [Candidatus Rokubacteria bacterium]
MAFHRTVRASPSPCYAPAVADEVSISRFRATCFAWLAKVKRTGRPILVTRKGEPIAQIIPPPPRRTVFRLGSLRATGRITGDILSPAAPENKWETGRR